MKIEVVPLAGLILGVLFFDQKWQDQNEQTYFEIVICLGILGIKFRWYDL